MRSTRHVRTKSEQDKQVIEAVVRRFGPLSRVEIRDLTHLQLSAISRLTRELLEEGWLREAGRADNATGRKQVLLRLNEEHGFVLGVGFDDENVLAAVMDLRPRMRSTVKESTRLDHGPDGLVNQLLSCAREATRQAQVPLELLLGIGVAGSGLVESRRGAVVMSTTIEFLRELPLQQIFEKEFGLPALVENITRAKTVAERALGAGAAAEDMIYVEYGRTGIGAGIISGGKLVLGCECAAGEFGHTHMTEEGPACKCGSFGCLEAIAGAAALEARIRKAIAEGARSEAPAFAGGDGALSGWTVLRAARMGDKICTAIVEQAADYLGLGLANLVNLFNPSVLVLDQRLSLAGDGLLDQIVRTVKKQALRHSTRQLSVRFGKLGEEASVLGVGAMVLDIHFEIPALKPPRFMVESVSGPSRSRRTQAVPDTEASAVQPDA